VEQFVVVGIYASGKWKISTKIKKKLNVFHHGCLHRSSITYHDDEILLRIGLRRMTCCSRK